MKDVCHPTIPCNPHCTNVDHNPSLHINHNLYIQADSNHQAPIRPHGLPHHHHKISTIAKSHIHTYMQGRKEGTELRTTQIISPPDHYTLKFILVALLGRMLACMHWLLPSKGGSKRTCRDGGADSRCGTRGRGHHSRKASPGHRSGRAVCLATARSARRRRRRRGGRAGMEWRRRAMGCASDAADKGRGKRARRDETSESLGRCAERRGEERRVVASWGAWGKVQVDGCGWRLDMLFIHLPTTQ